MSRFVSPLFAPFAPFAPFALIATLSLFFISCSGDSSSASGNVEKSSVLLASSYPLADWASALLAGTEVELRSPALAGDGDLRDSAPNPEDLLIADLIILNGAGFENWLDRVSLPEDQVLRTANVFAKDWKTFETVHEGHDDEVHAHPEGHDHDHGHVHTGTDPHTWLDPLQAKQQALAIAEALIKLYPEHAETIQANQPALLAKFDDLQASLAGIKPVHFLTSHPAYEYLARRHSWKTTALDISPDAALAPAELEAVAAAKAEMMLWEGEPCEAIQAQLTKLTLPFVVFSPVERKPESGDYFTAMQENIDRLKAALK